MNESNAQAGSRFEGSAAGRFAPPPPGAQLDLIAVGDEPTDVIPRVWAERMLRILRTENAATWRKLIGRVSAP